MSTQLFFVESPFFSGPLYHRLIRAAQIIWGGITPSKRPMRLSTRLLALRTVHVGLCRGEEIIHAIHPKVCKESVGDVLDRYSTRFPHCRLWVAPLFSTGQPNQLEMWETAETYLGRPYDWLGAVRAGVDGDFEEAMPFFRYGPDRKSTGALFCSELVSRALRGFASNALAQEEQTPYDVLTDGWVFLQRRELLGAYWVQAKKERTPVSQGCALH